MAALDDIQTLRDRVAAGIIGQREVVDSLILGLLSDGHLLLEGLPGLAKTRAVKCLAAHLDAKMSRIQFTPDLLPSDVTGTVMLGGSGDESHFRFDEGPIFANLVLVDEINRAPAKVQSALLEAMEERQVTAGGATHTLPRPFMVMATQNPIEQEGTYPLPEAQLDRFLMHVFVDYPDRDAEAEILHLVRGEEGGTSAEDDGRLSTEAVFAARKAIQEGVTLSENVEQYLVDLVLATRPPRDLDEMLGKWIEVGGSPRATIALDKCARARAFLDGRDHVTPDDVRSVAHGVLRHRLILSYEARADGVTANDVVDRLLDVVAIAG